MSTTTIRIRVPRALKLRFAFETDSVAGLLCCEHWFSQQKNESLAMAARVALEKHGYTVPDLEGGDEYTALDAAQGSDVVRAVWWHPAEGFELPLTDSDGALYCAIQCMKNWVRAGYTTPEALAAVQAELDRRLAERKAS